MNYSVLNCPSQEKKLFKGEGGRPTDKISLGVLQKRVSGEGKSRDGSPDLRKASTLHFGIKVEYLY